MIIGKPVDELIVTIVQDVLNSSNFRYCRIVAGCGFESYNVEKLEDKLCQIISAKYEVIYYGYFLVKLNFFKIKIIYLTR